MSGRTRRLELELGPFGWWIPTCRNRIKMDPESSLHDQFSDNTETNEITTG